MKAIRVLLALVFALLLIAALQAQTQAPAVPQDELVTAWLETARLSAQLANTACQQTSEVKAFNTKRAEVQKKVEQRVPGYTVDWQRFALAPIAK